MGEGRRLRVYNTRVRKQCLVLGQKAADSHSAPSEGVRTGWPRVLGCLSGTMHYFCSLFSFLFIRWSNEHVNFFRVEKAAS